MNLRTRRLPAGWAFAACVTLGCSSSSAPSAAAVQGSLPRVFTGQVDGTDVRVAVVATTHHARVFFCGGAATYATSTHWFLVDIGPSGQVASPSDCGLSFSGQVGDGVVRGSLVGVDGRSHTFVASPISAGTIAGLYEPAQPCGCGKLGLIVSQSSPAVAPTGQGACIGTPGASGATPVEQVTPLRPLTRAADGTIRVTIAGSADEVSAGPAAAPAE
jgi:hypothetical protein